MFLMMTSSDLYSGRGVCATSKSLVRRVLGASVAVFIGLISAALYMAAALNLSAIGGMGLSNPTETSSAVESAESYYQRRSSLDNVRKALAILEAATAKNPQSYDAWWRIAEYDCFLARHLPDNEEIPVLESGIAAGKKAEAIAPSRPEAHFWTGADEGLLAEERGLWGGLRLIDPVRIEMQTVMKLAPDYQQDGAERLLGRLYYEAPFFKGGDKKLSVKMLEHCLKLYPNNSLTMLYLADSYRALGRRGEAHRLLEQIMSLRPTPADAPELAENKADARWELRRYFGQDG